MHVSFIVGKVLQDPSAPIVVVASEYTSRLIHLWPVACRGVQQPPAPLYKPPTCNPKLSRQWTGAGNTRANARWLKRSEHKIALYQSLLPRLDVWKTYLHR